LHALGTAPFRAHEDDDDDQEKEEYDCVFTKTKLLAFYVFEVILYFLSSLAQAGILHYKWILVFLMV